MADEARALSFLQYKQADHEQGRQQPYVRDLVAWMEREQLEGNIASLKALREMKIDEARFALAKSEALGEVLKRMHEADLPEEAPEEDDFEDPATPPSERKNKGR